MDIGIKVLSFIVIICSLMLLVFDVERIENSKENQYEAVRAANQNSLIQIQISSQIIDEEKMLENWIKNYQEKSFLI